MQLSPVYSLKTNYPLAAELYLGAQPDAKRSKGIAHDLVLRLMRDYLNIGRNVTIDNLFTGVVLGNDLMEKGTTMVGTIRSNKVELPKIFASKDEAKKEVNSLQYFASLDRVNL